MKVTIIINGKSDNYIKTVAFAKFANLIGVRNAYDTPIPYLCGKPIPQIMKLLKALLKMQSEKPEIYIVYPGVKIKVEDISSLENPFQTGFTPKYFKY